MRTPTIITLLLSLLGFTACDTVSPDMYGTPHADFEIKGTVTDSAGAPVAGIEITTSLGDGDHPFLTGATNNEGKYLFTSGHSWTGDLRITATDTDGDANGGDFEPATKTIEVNREDYTDAGGWYEGAFSTTVDFDLTPKSDEAE